LVTGGNPNQLDTPTHKVQHPHLQQLERVFRGNWWWGWFSAGESFALYNFQPTPLNLIPEMRAGLLEKLLPATPSPDFSRVMLHLLL
jgi:hypothetical protein